MLFQGKRPKAEAKEQERKEKQDLGVCRIRRSERDRSSQTLGSGFVAKDLPGLTPTPYCLITSDKVFPKEDFNIENYYLDFKKCKSTGVLSLFKKRLETVRLTDVVTKSTVHRSSGLALIPINPSDKCGEKESIFTYRPFYVSNEGIKPDEDLRCHFVDDSQAESFDVKWLKLKHSDITQYELIDVHDINYKTYSEVASKGNSKPYGAVILKHGYEEFTVAGVLSFTNDERKNISPVFFPLAMGKCYISWYIYVTGYHTLL